jgi:16S rRNA (cytidine1402-2'-O)-methyltransferase
LLAVHRHNEAQGAQEVVRRLQQGERVPLPGASSITALLSASGGIADDGAFVFAGFLAAKAGERQQAVQALSQESRAVVLLEAPHRIAALADSMVVLGAREITVGREITKQFEEIATLRCDAFPAWLQASTQRARGEYALVLHATPAAEDAGEGLRVLRLLLDELPVKTAVKLAAEITGSSRNELYDAALKMKADPDSD